MARIFITGSTEGIGLAAARWLIDRGHEVLLHARSPRRAAALADLAGEAIGVVTGDLRSAAETQALAAAVNHAGRMDAVIHNAGIYTEPDRGDSPEGHAGILAVNTLAPFILTALIERPGRLIYLSSALHYSGEGSLADLDWTRRRWNSGKAYAESKLHAVALAKAVSRRWPDVLSNAVNPGWVRTRMGGAGAPVDIDTGQRTQTWLAVSDEPAALVSGGYWHDMRQEVPAAEAMDQRFQDDLVARLQEMTGIELPR